MINPMSAEPGGPAGRYAGRGGQISGGGGGAALGGAIFSHLGTVLIQNSTFTQNRVTRGSAGPIGEHCTTYPEDCIYYADNGQDEGGAIFAVDGSLTVQDSTIAGNFSSGEGAGIVVDQEQGQSAEFTLDNTIISNPSARECFYAPGVNANGSGNLVVNNFGCPGMVVTDDPQLGPLEMNGGFTPTMSITKKSPAFNAADSGSSLSEDQRGIYRPQAGDYDIGAYEACVAANQFENPVCVGSVNVAPTFPLTITVSPASGGTTVPAPGVENIFANSVLPLQAVAASGNSFLGWIGPVTDPTNPNTTIIMDQPQTITAQFTNLTTTMAGNIIAKSGPTNARVWTLSLYDNGPAGAAGTSVPTFTLVQTGGAACTPVRNSALPLQFGTVSAGQMGTANVTIDFTGCAANSRFTATFTYSANYGTVSGSVVRTNQFQ